MSKRVLVCGGRDYGCVPKAYNPYNYHWLALAAKKEQQTLYRVLDAAHRKYNIQTIIHGKARGADKLSGIWAASMNIAVEEYPANWTRDGNRAGPIRNQQMLDEGKPSLVIAFPGGNGTRDMVQRAKKAGVPVIEVNL